MFTFFSREIYINKDCWYFFFFSFLFFSLPMTPFANVPFQRTCLMTALAIFLESPFQDVNFFIDCSSFVRFSFEHIFFARSASDQIQTVFHFDKVKNSMLMYCPVWVFFRKIVKPLMHISKPKKCGVSLSNLATVNLRFLMNSLNAFNTLSMSWCLTSNLHNKHRILLFPLSLNYQLLLFHTPSL